MAIVKAQANNEKNVADLFACAVYVFVRSLGRENKSPILGNIMLMTFSGICVKIESETFHEGV